MILEVVQLRTKDGMAPRFEEAILQARPLFETAGCHGIEVVRSLEEPGTYFCLVRWETVEHHTEVFQKSPAYVTLFDLIGDTLAGVVVASHCTFVTEPVRAA